MSGLYFNGELEELDAVRARKLMTIRKPHYHQDIDVVEYTDYDHETIWENKQ